MEKRIAPLHRSVETPLYPNPNIEYRNPKQIQNPNFQMFKTETKGQLWSSLGFGHSVFEHSDLFRASCFGFRI